MRVAAWLAVALAAGVARGQKIQTIHFTGEKAVLGLPVDAAAGRVDCAPDGVTYFHLQNDPDRGAVAEVYGVPAQGEAKGVRRKMPEGYSSVTERDFFAGERELVTLLRGVKRDSYTGQVTDTAYLLSTVDRDGDFAKVVRLEDGFTPLKVGMFGSGEVLVLGWNEANLHPVLVTVKDDGSVRRFVDMDERGVTQPDRAELDGAVMVSHGDDVLLTYPGTRRSIRMLREGGDMHMIPILIPAGLLVHDVLVSETNGLVVLRAEADGKDHRASRMFEVDPKGGSLVREFVFSEPRINQVTCATGYSLTAFYMGKAAGADGKEAATQLVVSKVSRYGR